MKKMRIISLVLLLASSLFVAAEEQAWDAYRHSFRIGWGTAYSNRVLGYLNSYNTIPYYNTDYINNIQGMTAQEAHAYLTNYRMCTSKVNEISSGHIFASYAYQFTPLVSFGVEADVLFLKEQFDMMNGYLMQLPTPAVNAIYNLTLLPTVRFTYIREGYISMYSSVALGVTYSDFSSNLPCVWTEHSSANLGVTFNLAFVGLNFHYNGWYVEAELGCQGTQMHLWPESEYPIYSSRLLSVAIGYRF